ncbi:hypothetical protein ZHAS_00006524 [Anopheles sinensis]|uniref:Uncharacterized protein n=1 Tax=Anopheles sinensis TaxID=74873 RepID=A0A084VMJ2_ANOSI|nr:hypothetical protein ZHAS_00006524 [Anopheles sinensis]
MSARPVLPAAAVDDSSGDKRSNLRSSCLQVAVFDWRHDAGLSGSLHVHLIHPSKPLHRIANARSEADPVDKLKPVDENYHQIIDFQLINIETKIKQMKNGTQFLEANTIPLHHRWKNLPFLLTGPTYHRGSF